MLIGVPAEIKNHEYRVGMTPQSVYELIHHGHSMGAVTVALAAALQPSMVGMPAGQWSPARGCAR